MSKYPLRPLSSALSQAINSITIEENRSYPIAGIYSFGRGLIKRPSIAGTETSYRSMTRLHSSQLVMSKLNAWEGALAVVGEGFNGTFVSPEYPVFDIDEDVAISSYVKHLVTWPRIWELLTPRGSMVRRKRTSPETLLGLKVPLPDLREQRRIAAKLDALTARIQGIEALRSRASGLWSKFRESLIQHAQEQAVVHTFIGEALSLVRNPIVIDPDSTYRVIGMRSFGKGIIHNPGALGADLSKLNYFTFPPHALALSNIKAWEGAIGVTTHDDMEYVASNRFLFYVPNGGSVNVNYLRHYFLSKQGLAQISACSPGAADRNRTLGVKRFEGIPLDLPPIEVQTRTAHLLDSLGKGLQGAHTSQTLAILRPTLLNAAFGGSL